MRLDQTVNMINLSDRIGGTVGTVFYTAFCNTERDPVLPVIGKFFHDLRLHGNVIIAVLFRLQIADKQRFSHPDFRRHFSFPLTDLPHIERNIDKGAVFSLFNLLLKRIFHNLVPSLPQNYILTQLYCFFAYLSTGRIRLMLCCITVQPVGSPVTESGPCKVCLQQSAGFGRLYN